MRHTLHHLKISLVLCLLLAGFMTISCDKDDEDVSPATQLLSFGPSPALRGGDLKFIGKGLDKVTAIVLTDNVEVSSFKTKTPELIVLSIPDATVDGPVTLKTPDGNITTKTILEISEPIAITSLTPAKLRPGATLTIEGTYMNLVKQVIFSSKKAVSAFKSQSQQKLEVVVPSDAA